MVPGQVELFVASRYKGFMPNQPKPLPPLAEIRPHLEFYFRLGQNDKDIAANLTAHYDTELYGIGDASVKRLRKNWGLKNTHQQSESSAGAVAELRKKFPTRRAENIRKALNHRVVTGLEPDAVEARRQRYFEAHHVHTVGVNDVWSQGQHDKWGPRFGLWLHNNTDPFTGFNNWLKVWWTNKNPRLIAGYYIETIRKYGAVPLITQSCPGPENHGVANVQTLIRHELDPTLAGRLLHRWGYQKTDVKPGANWSVFRRDFAPGFEGLFESGVNKGWYDVNNHLENLVFRWLAIPWIQLELDRWIIFRNRTAPRADPKKIRPHGIPEMIRQRPERFGALDFKIPIPSAVIDRLENEYAPPDHEVFQLTPTLFHNHASAYYTALGKPPVSFDTFWDIYKQLLQCFRNANDETLSPVVAAHFDSVARVIDQKQLPLLPGMKELRLGDKVIGDIVAVGDEPDVFYASFTDEE